MSCALAGALSIAAPADADTLHPTGFISPPADTFQVHRDSHAQNVLTGGFKGTFNAAEIFFWCFDLDHYFSFGNDYPYVEQPLADPALETQLSRLFEEAYVPATTMGPDQSAAFQLAIWNLEYDADQTVSAPGFPINPTNHFWATGGPSNQIARDLANTWLQNLGNYTGNGWTVSELRSTRREPTQNFITATYVAPQRDVPEPATLPLALTALVALLLIRATKGERARGG